MSSLALALIISLGVGRAAFGGEVTATRATDVPKAPAPTVTTPKPNEPVAQAAQRPSGERVVPKHLRLSTPAEKAQWEKAVDALWNTPLGQLYGEYLFSPSPDHADLPLWARLLAQRMFQDPDLLTVRIAALQIMTEDLYVREKMTGDVSDRVMILGLHIQQKELLFEQNARHQMGNVVAPLVAIALPFGSRAVRQELNNAARFSLNRLFGRAVRAERHPRPARVITEFRDDYSIGRAAATFTGLWSAQTAYYFFNDWRYASTWAPKDQALLLGLDDLVRAMELPYDNPAFPLPRH